MDGDMNDIFQKLNNILEDPNMSDNLKNVLNNFSSSNTEKNTNDNLNNSKTNNSNNTERKSQNSNNSSNTSSSTQSPEFDINTILKMKKIMDSVNNTSDDPRANLLISLKPYLDDNKKEKVDQYVKFLHIAKVIEIINPIGGDEIKNE